MPGAFLVDDPEKLLSRNSDIPWIVGLNSAEGGLQAACNDFTYLLSIFFYSQYTSNRCRYQGGPQLYNVWNALCPGGYKFIS